MSISLGSFTGSLVCFFSSVRFPPILMVLWCHSDIHTHAAVGNQSRLSLRAGFGRENPSSLGLVRVQQIVASAGGKLASRLLWLSSQLSGSVDRPVLGSKLKLGRVAW